MVSTNFHITVSSELTDTEDRRRTSPLVTSNSFPLICHPHVLSRQLPRCGLIDLLRVYLNNSVDTPPTGTPIVAIQTPVAGNPPPHIQAVDRPSSRYATHTREVTQ